LAKQPSAPHGYSGKPLAVKLGLVPEKSAAIILAPAHYSELTDKAEVTHFGSVAKVKGEWDILHLFCRTESVLVDGLPRLLKHMAQGGMIWVSWPKKSSKLWQDLTEDGIRSTALPLGIVDVKVCAVDADWSGLKLMRRRV
jgi:hypothetical protein